MTGSKILLLYRQKQNPQKTKKSNTNKQTKMGGRGWEQSWWLEEGVAQNE